jgi:hypothetical protein
MRNLLPTFILLICWTAECQNTNKLLKFFIVSNVQAPGKHFIDCTPFSPNTGYLSDTPELVLTNIQKVERWPEMKMPDFQATNRVGRPFTKWDLPRNPRRNISVYLRSQDVPRFTEFYEAAVGKWVILTFGDETLGPPWMWSENRERVETFSIALTPDEFERRENELKRLIQ